MSLFISSIVRQSIQIYQRRHMCKSITDKKFFFQFIQHTNTQHTHTHAHRVVPRTLSDETSCLKGVNED